jgi:hypothetical protein
MLLSEKHKFAVNEYLNLCALKQVMPLPILNKVEKFESYRSLSLEDYSVGKG